MIRNLTTVIISLIFCLVKLTPLFASDENRNYVFEEKEQKLCRTIYPIDLNKDGEDELVIVYDVQLDVMDAKLLKHYLSHIFPLDREYDITPLSFVSLDSLSFLFHYITKDSSIYNIQTIINKQPLLIKKYFSFTGLDLSGDGRFNQSITEIGIFKNRAGIQLKLFSLNSDRDNAKRGVVAVIPETGEIKWEFLMGPHVVNPILDDFDGDGFKEIILGSYAPDNGAAYNGTKDDSSYVFVVDCDGKLRWRKTLGPYWTGACPTVGDFDNDGEKELIIYTVGTNSELIEQDKLMALDIETGELLKPPVRAGTKFTFHHGSRVDYSHDLSGDGVPEIVIGNTDGVVRMFDGNLDNIYSSKSFKQKVTVLGIKDLDGDKISEVICKTDAGKLLVLNNRLKLLGTYQLQTESFLSFVNTGKKYRLLLKTLSPGKYNVFKLIDFHPVAFTNEAADIGKTYLKWLIVSAFIILLALLVRNLFFGFQAKRIFFSFLESSGLGESSLIVSTNGKVLKIGNKWQNLLMVSLQDAVGSQYSELFHKNFQDAFVDSINKIFKTRLKEGSLAVNENNSYKLDYVHLSLFDSYCIFLNDLTEQEHLNQVKHWAKVAQRLAHGIKNPLTTVKLNAEQLKHTLKEKHQLENEEIDEYVDAIISQVSKLKKMSDGFMRFVEFEKPSFESVDINSVAKELIQQWLPERSLAIKINWELDENLPLTKIDRKQFEFALRNVFYNAVESMETGGRILIRTSLVHLVGETASLNDDKDFVEIQIQDTGCGIPAEYLDKVTQPYFSINKTDGTGLGLSIVKKIMDSFGGQFDIYSQEGVGTTVTMRFKIAGDKPT